MSTTPNQYKYLRPNPGSLYKQLFINGRIATWIIYGDYVNEEEPRTPEQIAEDYDLPLEAVLEAIAYYESKPPEMAQDDARSRAIMEASGMNDPDYKYHPTPKVLSPEEWHRLRQL